MTHPPILTLTVDEDFQGWRLDKFVAKNVEAVSRRTVMEMISNGAITVNHRRMAKSHLLSVDDRVEIWESPTRKAWAPKPDDSVDITICYEDDGIVAVNKPSGIPTVPLGPEETGTLANGLVHRFKECGDIYRHPGDGGLIQRLDKGTSGVVMAARSKAVFNALIAAQAEGEIEKKYFALVHTDKKIPDIIEYSLTSHGRNRHVVAHPDGRPAVTQIQIQQKRGPWKLIEATIHKGARHQIRAHLAESGMPIVGDDQYNRKTGIPTPGRLFLHAHCIEFRHPITQKKMKIHAPLPPELSRFIEKNLIISP